MNPLKKIMAKTQFLDDPRLNRHEFPDLRDSHLSCDVLGVLKDAQLGVSAEKNSD